MNDEAKCVCGCDRGRHIEAPGHGSCRGCDDCCEFRPVDAKCVCGHGRKHHPGGALGCHFPPFQCDCQCQSFRPASEAKPEPAPESVYERARRLVYWTAVAEPAKWTIEERKGRANLFDAIRIALDAGEKAEKELREWKLASQNQTTIAPSQLTPNPEADEVRACMAEGLAATRRGHFELIARADAAERLCEERLDHIVELEREARIIKAALVGLGPHPAERERNEAQNERQREHDLRVTATGSLESAMARVRELEASGVRLLESYNHEIERVHCAHREIAQALALLKPARPEDGLLPAIRDVLQQLELEKEGGKEARKECERLENVIAEKERPQPVAKCPKCGCEDFDPHDGYCEVCGTV